MTLIIILYTFLGISVTFGLAINDDVDGRKFSFLLLVARFFLWPLKIATAYRIIKNMKG